MEKRYNKAETVAIMDSSELKMFSSHRRDGPTVKRAYLKKKQRVQNQQFP